VKVVGVADNSAEIINIRIKPSAYLMAVA